MKTLLPDRAILQKEYEDNFQQRVLLTRELEQFIEKEVSGLHSNLTIKGRVKSFDSYFKKLLRYLKDDKIREAHPLIPDQVGIRVVCPFIEDTSVVEEILKNVFDVAEIERKGSGYSFKEFGYESTHILIKIPEILGKNHTKSNGENFTGDIAEIQIRTILQDAWAEVEHELVYKAEFRPFDAQMKRKLAAINASLSLADTVFQEIRKYQNQLNDQLDKRHESFFKKIEESTDSFLENNKKDEPQQAGKPYEGDSTSIDNLLLNALYAHNRGLFDDAIMSYTAILKLNPEKSIAAIIHKHRGMAYFAQSFYKEAIDDFNDSVKIDPASYRSAYYSGVVRLVLQEYAKAIDDFGKSLEINPYQSFCFYRRAEAYYHLEDYPKALSDCESALSLDHKFPGALTLKTMLLDKLKM